MELPAAVEVLKGCAIQPEHLAAAFQTARLERRTWPITDLLDFRDIAQGPFDLPASSTWAVDVDAITKPKQSGGVRVERLMDAFTGTLLQSVANRLKECEERRRLPIKARFAGLQAHGARSYEAWARAIAGWLTQRLGKGQAVVVVDFADFFPSIRPERIKGAMISAGIAQDAAQGLLVLFDRINRSCARDDVIGQGLPTIPDEIAWLVADAVMREFDDDVVRQPSVLDYARWVDDCYIACDPGQCDGVLQRVSDLASRFGLQLNPHKARVLRDLRDLDEAMLRQEHDLVADLLAVATAGGASGIDLAHFLPQLTPRISGNRPEAARLVKRLFAVAAAGGSRQLLTSAGEYLRDYPAAERPILSYLLSLGWPGESHELLERSLSGEGYDSRQILALKLLLESKPGEIPAGARDACMRIVEGKLPAHAFARTLAFAVLMDDQTDDVRRLRQRFAAELGNSPSAMARRVGLQLLFLIDVSSIDLRPFLQDPSPLVRHFASFALPRRKGLGADRAAQGPCRRAWKELQQRLLKQLDLGLI